MSKYRTGTRGCAPSAWTRALATIASLAGLLGPASAATLVVTTTDDVVALDSECSLREAVTAANTNSPFMDCDSGDAFPTIDVIELAAGTYSLSIDQSDEDANEGGDLDIAESLTIRGLGEEFAWWDDPDTEDVETLDVWGEPEAFPRTFGEENLPEVVIANGLGKPSVPGDGDRVIHVLPGAAPVGAAGVALAGAEIATPEGPNPEIRLENLAIVGGDGFCDEAFCDAGAAGLLHEASIRLVLDRVALFDNKMRCIDPGCGSSGNAAVLRVAAGGDVFLQNSVVAGNSAACADSGCTSGGIVEISSPDDIFDLDATLVAGNQVSCSSVGCSSNDVLVVQAALQVWFQAVVAGNESSCTAFGFSCSAGSILDAFGEAPTEGPGPGVSLLVQNSEVSTNALSGSGDLESLFRIDHTTALLERVRLQANSAMCSGPDCSTDNMFRFADSIDELQLAELEVSGNQSLCSGRECSASSMFFVTAPDDSKPTMIVTDLTVMDNHLSCSGLGCGSQSVLALRRPLQATDILVDQNTTECDGDYCFTRSIVRFGDGEAGDDGAAAVDGLMVTGNQSLCAGTPCSSGTRCSDGDGSCDPGTGGTIEFGFDDPSSLVNATISGNETSSRGGGLVSLKQLTVTASAISGNVAGVEGGGIFAGFLEEQGEPLIPSAITLVDSTVDGNTATGNGGGVLIPPGGMVMLTSGSTVTGNTAADGGGVYNEGAISGDDLSSQISGNAPNQCVNSGAGAGCPEEIFADGFESGDTTSWSSTIP